MHWTLQLLLVACCLSVVSNLVVFCLGGKVKPSGLMVCGFWGLQQSYWAITGTDSLLLFAICDGVLIAYLWKRRTDWKECLILASLLPCALIYIHAALYGPVVWAWWLNWALVLMQMVVGLPAWKLPGPILELKHEVS